MESRILLLVRKIDLDLEFIFHIKNKHDILVKKKNHANKIPLKINKKSKQ